MSAQAPQRLPASTRQAATSETTAREPADAAATETVVAQFPWRALDRLQPGSRAWHTQQLLSRWTPLLGLDARHFEVRWDDAARRMMRARQFRGLLQNRHRILLDPEHYHPERLAGQFLLAHELAHLSQATRNDGAVMPRALLEADADAAASALLLGSGPVRVRARLPSAFAAREAADDQVCYDLGNIVATSREREINAIKEALETGFFDWAVTDGDVDTVLRILQTMEFATASAVIQKIGATYQDKLLDNFSDSHFKKYRFQVLAAYVGVGPDLLAKYRDSLFEGMDWSGFTPEEHFAVKRVIQQVREQTKQADWSPKGSEPKVIEEILSRESLYRFDDAYQQESKRELEVSKRRAQAQAALKDTATGVPRIIEMARNNLSYQWNDWAVTDGETIDVLDAMSGIMDDPVLMRAVAEGLEQEGLLDRFIDNLPVSMLYQEIGRKQNSVDTVNRRKIFLRLISYRDAYKNVKQAEELLERGLFDWAITDEDAFLAFQLIKVVPPRARTGFLARSVGSETYGSRLEAERSISMRESLTSNFYRGGVEGEDLKSIQTQLLDDALWTRDGQGRLSGLIQMAIAAGEHEWVFEQSRWRYLRQETWQNLYDDATFSQEIIEKYRLYRPRRTRKDGTLDEGRTAFNERVAEKLEGKPFGTDNLFWLYVIQGIDFLASSKDPAVFFTTSIGGEGLNFGEFQDLFGGSFSGITFQRCDASAFAEGDYFDNKVRWDTDQGVLEMGARVVDISAINYLMDNFKFQSGTGNLQNMHVHMGYPRLKGKPTYLQLEIDSAVLNDVLLISTDSMVSVREVSIEGLSIELGSPDIDYDALPHPREQLDWLSVLGRAPLPGVLFTGWLGKFLNLGDYGAELTNGLLTPQTRMDMTLTCQSFKVHGITTSSGQYIESLELGKIALRTAGPRENYRAHLEEQLTKVENQIVTLTLAAGGTPTAYDKYRVGRLDALRAKRDSIASELAYIDSAEKECKRLQEQQAQGSLSMHEQQKLDRLTHYLADLDQGGVNLDIGSTSIKGIAGKVSMGDVTLEEIHGHGRSADATVGMLGIESLNRMLRGPGYKPVLLGHDEPPDFELAIKKIELQAIDVAGAIPTVVEAAKDLAEAKAKVAANPDDFARLARAERASRRLAAAKVYWDIVSRVSGELSSEDRDSFAKAKEYLLSEKAFHADSISLGDVSLGVHGVGGATEVSLAAGSLDAKNLQAAGFTTAQIEGKGIWIGGAFQGGLAALADPRRNLSSGAVKADFLELTRVRHATAGELFQKATATSLGAEMENRGAKVRLGAKSLQVTGLGVSPTLELLRKRLDYLKSKESPSASDLAKIKEIEERLTRLDAYVLEMRQAQHDLNEAKTDEARSQAEHRIVMAEELIIGGLTAFGAAGLDLRDFGVEIEGLGDILDESFDIGAAIDRGLAVRGTGPAKRIWSGLEIRWAQGEVSGEQSVIAGSVEKIAAGELKGEIGYSSGKIALSNVQLASLTLDGMFFASSTATSDLQIWSDGETTMSGLTIDGSFEFRDTTEKERAADPKKTKALSSVTLNNFRIDSLTANSFGIRTSEPNMQVDVNAGTLTGLWAKGLKLGLPPEGKPITIEGESGLEGASGLDFTAILKKSLAASAGAAEKKADEGLGFEFVGEQGFTFTLGELNIASGVFRGPDGRARFSLEKLKGTFKGKGDSMKFEQWSLGALTLNGFHWKAGEKGFVESKGTTQIIGVKLSAEILTKLTDKQLPPGQVPDPSQPPEQIRVVDKIKVTELRIDSIISDHLIYQDDGMKVEIRKHDPATDPEEMAGYQPFFIGDVVLTDLEWSELGGATQGSLELGKVETSGFFEDFKSGLTGGLALKAKGMGASFFGKDLTTLSLGEIEKSGGYVKHPGAGIDARFTMGKMVGGIHVKDNQIAIKKLSMDDLTITGFTWKAGDTEVRSSKPTILHGLWVDAELNYEQQVDAKGKKTKVIDNVTVSHLHVDKVTADELIYESGDLTIELTPRKLVAKGDPAPLEIETIDLTGLVWEPDKGVREYTLDAVKASANFVTTLKSGLTKEIEVTTDLVASTLRVQLKRDGKMLASIDELAALAEGDVKGVKMKTLVSKAKTGTITYSPDDNKIEMPAFGISSLALQQLSYDSPDFKIEVPYGHGGVVMVDIEVDMTVNLNPPPAKGAAPITPAPSRIKNVTINSFKVPTTTAWGLTFTLKDPTDPIVIKVDESKPAVLSGLGLKPATAMVFTPKVSTTGTTWDILGNVTLDSADVKQIGVEVGKSISAHADVTASTFTLDFLGAGKTRFNIASVTAQEIRGKLGNNDFKLITGTGGSKFQDPSDPTKPKPGIKLTNVGRDETGKFSIGDVGVYGFVYNDPSKGLHLDVAEALLKDSGGAALTVENGEIVVPSIEISNAYFKVDDVLKLGGGSGGGTASPISYTPDWKMLDQLDGTVSFAALLHSNSWSQRTFEGQIDVLVQITDGVVNFSDIEDHAFGFGDWLVDFEVDTSKTPAQLYLELDMHMNQRMLEWNLDDDELTLAKSNQVRLRTFLKTTVVPQPAPDPDDEPFRINSLHYQDASVDLHMPDNSTIDLGNAGTLQLGGGANSEHALRLWGSRKGRLDHWGGLPLNLEAHVAKTDLKIADGTKQLSIGQIHVDGLKDAHLDFNDKAVSEGINIDVPKKLEGTITHATAKNLRIKPVKP